MAVDYFQSRYPGTTVVFDMSLVYIIVAFFTVLVNNLLVETLSLNARISFGECCMRKRTIEGCEVKDLLINVKCEVFWRTMSGFSFLLFAG